MPSPEQDIKFLKVQLEKRQIWYEDSDHLIPSDLLLDHDAPVTSPDEERIARLADKNGFDGSLFRNLTKDREPLSHKSIKRLVKQIETIPRIIATIEESQPIQKPTTTLPMFIGKYCKNFGVISSKVKTLQKYDRKGLLKLPALAVKWKRGQAKQYYIDDLKQNWNKYRQTMPVLPELK